MFITLPLGKYRSLSFGRLPSSWYGNSLVWVLTGHINTTRCLFGDLPLITEHGPGLLPARLKDVYWVESNALAVVYQRGVK